MQKAKTQANDVKPRSRLATLRERAAGVDPMIMAAGAAVVGAVAAAVVPQSPSEMRLLAPTDKSLNNAARTLGSGARQALSAELAGVPVVGQIAAEQIDRVIDSVVQPDGAETGGTNAAEAPVAQTGMAA